MPLCLLVLLRRRVAGVHLSIDTANWRHNSCGCRCCGDESASIGETTKSSGKSSQRHGNAFFVILDRISDGMTEGQYRLFYLGTPRDF